MTIPLSILDLIPLPSGSTSADALRNSLDLARLGDQLGYHRYWFAEHHNMATVVSTTPEIMIAQAAGVTERIRVGSGGVMLPNHTPLQVAETFKMLEALYPGRIDLGIGRAPGTDQATAVALRGSRGALAADDFPDRLQDLVAFGEGRSTVARVAAMPPDVRLPPIFLLGSSDFSAQLSAHLGMGFGFAAHFSDFPPEGPMLGYRKSFKPGALDHPYAILTLSVVCAETDSEAERLASSLLVSFARLRTGQTAILLPPDEALAYPFTPMELGVAESVRGRQIVGSPAKVKAAIEELAARTQADEVMITTFVHGHEERKRSYELVAGIHCRS
jgi:luciferase family oxidoreductase group 1